MSDTEGTVQPATGGGKRSFGALLPVGIFALVASMFLVALFFGNPSKLPSTLIGKPLPAFEARGIPGVFAADGSPVPGFTHKDLATGELTLLNVWATWCTSCRLEHPFLMTMKERTGVRVFGLDYKDTATAARRYLSVHGNPFEKLGEDKDGRIAIDLGVYGVPETFLVDGDGTVLLRHPGPVTEAVLKTLIEPAIAKARARAARGPAGS